ncbi:MAG: WYL domain-containing protein [Nitrospirae bacterium]|nr:WYL domain-containing protein [Nitrospirota bacterium]
MPRHDQVIRQWKILKLLESRGRVTFARLVADLGEPCHPRTLRRDLEALSLIGVPIYTEQQNGGTVWILSDDYRAFPLPVTPTELLALDAARRFVEPLDGTFVAESLAAVLAKIRAALPPATITAFGHLTTALSIGQRPTKVYGPHAQTVDTLWTAIQETRVVKMTYDSHHAGRVTSRDVDPYHVRTYDNTLYLVAYCHRRKDILLFVVDRIKRIELTDQRFTLPLYFSPDEYFKDAFGIYQGGRVESVSLVFKPHIARWVCEKHWHRSQRFTPVRGQGVRMDLSVPLTPEFVAWVRSFGPDVTVQAPVKLVDIIKKDAWEVVGRYEGTKGARGKRGAGARRSKAVRK